MGMCERLRKGGARPRSKGFPFWSLIAFVVLGVLPAAVAGGLSGGDGEAPLDARYRRFERGHLEGSETRISEVIAFADSEPAPQKSDFLAHSRSFTPARSQGGRGTCSIFSAIAWLEFWTRRNRGARATLDLSEEWLQYLVSRFQSEDGSDSLQNFELLRQWGAPREESLPYLEEDWLENPSRLSEERCGGVPRGRLRRSCLIGHWDPRALDVSPSEREEAFPALERARREAEARTQRLGMIPQSARSSVRTVQEAKRLLADGIPLTLDLDFFYGAWNHREAVELGIGRNEAAWTRGDVGFPEEGSLDLKNSEKDPAGHSVLVVGFDDTEEVVTRSRMQDGSIQEFRYRGVYYFKNSWGTEGFGREFQTQGVALPGYGRITQRYAHRFGAFYRMDLPEKAR
jgi:hypothetical protein